jgi:hypothetical protein
MTDEKLLEALDIYFQATDVRPEKLADNFYLVPSVFINRGARLRHIAWMCKEVRAFVTQGRREKAMRWLGFIQGVIWSTGLFSLDQIKNHVRPDEPEP